jgi:cytochrome c oxidase subunit IV
MATTQGTTEAVVHDDADHDAHRTGLYVQVAAGLGLLTALEVSTYLLPKDLQHQWYFAVALCIMMSVKFVVVTAFFMHLKFDKRFLTVVFYSGLVLAVGVYVAVLTMFRFWEPPSHMVR